MSNRMKLTAPVLTVGLITLFAGIAFGKLSSDTFDRMIKESDLIYVARPQRIELCEYPNICSEAVVIPGSPRRIYKGKPDSKLLIKASNEVHDQGISDFSEHLLFLKRKGPKDTGDAALSWLPTSYGRSCIRLEKIHKSQIVSPYPSFEEDFRNSNVVYGFFMTYPNSMIVFPSGLSLKIRVAQAQKYPAEYVITEAILLPELERYMRKRL